MEIRVGLWTAGVVAFVLACACGWFAWAILTDADQSAIGRWFFGIAALLQAIAFGVGAAVAWSSVGKTHPKVALLVLGFSFVSMSALLMGDRLMLLH